MSKKSNNPMQTEWAGRHRLWKVFNSHSEGFTDARKISDFSRVQGLFSTLEGVTLRGWFQYGRELTALYQSGNALILLERFVDNEDESEWAVACVGAPTWDEVVEVVAALLDLDEVDVAATGESGAPNA
jgi:hypothetical protein